MSKKYSLNSKDLEKILSGAVVAVVGAALTYVAQVVTQIDFGTLYTPFIVAVVSILVNTGKKWVAGR